MWVSFPRPLDHSWCCARTLCLRLSNCCSRHESSDAAFLSSPVRWFLAIRSHTVRPFHVSLVPRLLCAQCVFNPRHAHLVLLPRVRHYCSGSLSSRLFVFVLVARSPALPWLPPLIVRLSPLFVLPVAQLLCACFCFVPHCAPWFFLSYHRLFLFAFILRPCAPLWFPPFVVCLLPFWFFFLLRFRLFGDGLASI